MRLLRRAPREVYRVYGEREFLASVEPSPPQPGDDGSASGARPAAVVCSPRGVIVAALIASIGTLVALVVAAKGASSASRREGAGVLASTPASSLETLAARRPPATALGADAGNAARPGRAQRPARGRPVRGHPGRPALAPWTSRHQGAAQDRGAIVPRLISAQGATRPASDARFSVRSEPAPAQAPRSASEGGEPAPAAGAGVEFGFER